MHYGSRTHTSASVALPACSRVRPRQRRGAAVVECALVTPLLALLLLGMFELGRAMMAKESLCNAARKGCRTGIQPQYGNCEITNDCTNVMRNSGYDVTTFDPPNLGAITISVKDPNGNVLADALDAPPGSKVSVQVSIPVSSVLWTSSNFLTGSMLQSDVMIMMKQ